jgi:thioesterase domain-containing protein
VPELRNRERHGSRLIAGVAIDWRDLLAQRLFALPLSSGSMESRPAIDPAAVERYLHEHIPISAAMAISVTRADIDGVTLTAPLEPNINHRSTVFGGSCASVAILAAWTLVHLHVKATGRPARIVIQRGATEYLASIAGEFSATCQSPEPAAWMRFDRAFERRGQARMELAVEVLSDGQRVAAFCGLFVAIAGTLEG